MEGSLLLDFVPKDKMRSNALSQLSYLSVSTSMAACPSTLAHLKSPWLGSAEGCSCKTLGDGGWRSSLALESDRRGGGSRGVRCRATADGEAVGVSGEGRGEDPYLARGFGWGVRRMARDGEEMKRVAQVQAEAFHEPVALFNDLLFELFKAEVLSALMYRLKNSAHERYACLVAEAAAEGADRQGVPEIVGVVDATVQRDGDVVRHLRGAQEYVYVSGLAVLIKFRRRKIASMLLDACDALSRRWGYDHLALRAYEEDSAAQTLYSKAGYRVVSADPSWITLIGKKRRVLMVRHSASNAETNLH